MKIAHIAALIGTIALAPAAFATTYSNVGNESIAEWGSPDTTTYGETFTLAAGQTLQDWSFTTVGGNGGNYTFDVAAWNGSRATGSDLYSKNASYAGGAQTLSFSGIDTALAAGTYVAYITTAGASGPVSGVETFGSSSNGGLGGEFVYLNSGGADPLTVNASWSTYIVPDMQFSATFGAASAVPEASNVALLLAGLGLVGFAARRRQRNG